MAIRHTDGQLSRLASPAIRISPRKQYKRRRLEDNATEPIVRFHRSTAWRKLSERFRRDNPVCEDPLGLHEGRLEASRTVHHIEPLAARYDLRLEESNLSALCWRCHLAIEGKADQGEATAHLFPRETEAPTGNRGTR